MSEVTISVNGEPRVITGGVTVSELLAMLNLDAKSVLVELNNSVLQRHEYPLTVINSGDRLELLRVVAGG